MFQIGGDVVGIVKRTKTAARDRFQQRIAAAEQVVIKSGCLFEVQPTAVADKRETPTSPPLERELAWVFLPVDADTRSITAADAIRYPVIDDDGNALPADDPRSRTYEMAGDGVVEPDIHGRRDHVACVCEWQQITRADA
ncbi:Uncharacterised protein [Mycobacteroides abscessus subsp. abscessus]|uniref:hypothetical protein n=1 Tax=Mycobacteroides abscessus TaxID=36809 RepID=UPI00092C6374|nr:hypothetical protein [Mycobacteroides abscessus]SID10490.1 Uncharacterised protein [Mycobacteroides abscessus subsp. abscessus]SKU77551.1 Uncharacterised protein [Mycobacteroides abscessus subsp. abscessus]